MKLPDLNLRLSTIFYFFTGVPLLITMNHNNNIYVQFIKDVSTATVYYMVIKFMFEFSNIEIVNDFKSIKCLYKHKYVICFYDEIFVNSGLILFYCKKCINCGKEIEHASRLDEQEIPPCKL